MEMAAINAFLGLWLALIWGLNIIVFLEIVFYLTGIKEVKRK